MVKHNRAIKAVLIGVLLAMIASFIEIASFFEIGIIILLSFIVFGPFILLVTIVVFPKLWDKIEDI